MPLSPAPARKQGLLASAAVVALAAALTGTLSASSAPAAASEADRSPAFDPGGLVPGQPLALPCDALSGPVCGQPPGCKPSRAAYDLCELYPPETYPDECAAERASAQAILHHGPCRSDSRL